MDLREYLFRNRISITDFAKQVNASRNHISGITNRAWKPGKYLALLIENVTNGEVTAEELLSDNQTPSK